MQSAVLEDAGMHLCPGARVLDFGCGDGRMCTAWSDAGFEAFGTDFPDELGSGNRLLPINDPYELPFESNFFDFAFSDQVLEHVQDYASAFGELARVLKPGAAALHLFPPGLRPIEAHTLVPLGGVLRSQWWLTLWAAWGIRNTFQKRRPASEVVRLNHEYLTNHTSYPSRRRLARVAGAHFREVRFVERLLLRHTYGRARMLAPIAAVAARPYATFYSRAMLVTA